MHETQSGDPRHAAKLAAMLNEVIRALDEAGHQTAACHVDLARHLVQSEQAKNCFTRRVRSRVSKS